MNYTIREAIESDAQRIEGLLYTIAELHRQIRPDLFKQACSKYNIKDLHEKFMNPQEKIFVAADERNIVLGYVFCIIQEYIGNNVLTDHKTLYIDDLCVDKNARGFGVATALMDRAVSYAREIACHNITLNVWTGNSAAERFYEKYGLKTQSKHLEMVLS
ncbi:MAG: GNAT family N-acetyltransferase [Clostridiales bacterium]|nr:MAG: GNAT family N-acetyltransferase [Clostridiales bacterium]